MFMQQTPKNYHVQYLDVTHHWSPRSEDFAGGDCLLTALQRGWEVAYTVEEEKYWHGDVRAVSVYHFTLRRGNQEIVMPVIENPYVTRMLFMEPFEVVERGDADAAHNQEAS